MSKNETIIKQQKTIKNMRHLIPVPMPQKGVSDVKRNNDMYCYYNCYCFWK